MALSVGAAEETVTVTANPGGRPEGDLGQRAHHHSQATCKLSSISVARWAVGHTPGAVALEKIQSLPVSLGGATGPNANDNVNGPRGLNHNVTMDGSMLIDIGSNHGTTITPNTDIWSWRSRFRPQPRRRTRHGGGQVTVTSKSGSSAYHGEAYHYIRNQALNANERFNNRVPFPPHRIHPSRAATSPARYCF